MQDIFCVVAVLARGVSRMLSHKMDAEAGQFALVGWRGCPSARRLSP